MAASTKTKITSLMIESETNPDTYSVYVNKKKIGEHLRFEEALHLMDMVENMKGEVMVISCEHDGGKQLESLGGIAAILRYSLS